MKMIKQGLEKASIGFDLKIMLKTCVTQSEPLHDLHYEHLHVPDELVCLLHKDDIVNA